MDSELAAWAAGVQRFNPNHVAAGQAGGGQFAPASGGGGSSSAKGAKGAKGKSVKGKKTAGRPTPTNAHPVGMGETGQRVHDLQERLNALGAHLKVDGIFGPKTRAAVLAFQKSHGLKPDALVGPKTTAALRTKAKAPAKHKAKAAHHKTTHHAATVHKPAKPAAKPAPAKPAAAKAPAPMATAKRSGMWAADWARAWSR